MDTETIRVQLISSIREDAFGMLTYLRCLPRLAVDIQGKQGYSERFQHLIETKRLIIGNDRYRLEVDCESGEILAVDSQVLRVYAVVPSDFDWVATYLRYMKLSKDEVSPYIDRVAYNRNREKWLKLYECDHDIYPFHGYFKCAYCSELYNY